MVWFKQFDYVYRTSQQATSGDVVKVEVVIWWMDRQKHKKVMVMWEYEWLQPDQEESTTSRLISEEKSLRAQSVPGLETTWEHWVLQSLFCSFLFVCGAASRLLPSWHSTQGPIDRIQNNKRATTRVHGKVEKLQESKRHERLPSICDSKHLLFATVQLIWLCLLSFLACWFVPEARRTDIWRSARRRSWPGVRTRWTREKRGAGKVIRAME